MKIAILGGGSWGTALAVHLAKKKYQVKIWEFFAEQASEMQESRICPLLPDILLPKNIFISSNLEEVILDSGLILIVVPSDKVEVTMENAKPFIEKQPLIICSKGFGSDLKFLSEILNENFNNDIYCLYGPTHAEEVGHNIFSGIVLAGGDDKEKIREIIQSDDLHVDLSDDLIGVQIASSLKNVLAVFVGVLEGAGFGDNTVAYVITKGLKEMSKVGQKLGAKNETFYGLAGMGDVIVTCTSKHSRNKFVGQEIGKGKKLQEVLDEMSMVAEGIVIAEKIPELIKKTGLTLPLFMSVYRVIFEGLNPELALRKTN